MKIAISSANGKTISGHAGKCPGFLLFEIQENETASLGHEKLSKEKVFRNLNGELRLQNSHPLSDIDLLITKSSGAGLIERLKREGIDTFLTDISEPEKAIAIYLKTSLTAIPRAVESIVM